LPAKNRTEKLKNDRDEGVARQTGGNIVPRPVCKHLCNNKADLLLIYQQVINNPSCMSLKPLWARI